MKPIAMLVNTCTATAMFLFAGSALAASCSTSPDLDTTDMMVNGNSATDCRGPVRPENNSESVLAAYVNDHDFFGGGWTHAARYETDTGTSSDGDFMGIQFNVVASDGTSGDFTLALTDANGALPPDFPFVLDLLGILKGAGNPAGDLAAYFFDAIALSADNAGSFTMNFANGGGKIPALSYMDFLVRIDAPNQVPEPASGALLGLGLLGFVASRRYRWRNRQA
jgi:hypothetical protein